MPFLFENLDVYKCSLDYVESVEALLQQLKGKVSFSFCDQLCRAALSIPLNISEGQGRWHLKEKRQFYWIARGSTFETVPLIQIFSRRGLIAQPEYQTLYSQVESLAKMLTNLIKSVDDLKRD